MTRVSMLELRRDADAVLKRVQSGERLLLTYRGRPAARLEPVRMATPGADDPFYRLTEAASATGGNLSNATIDRVVYGK